MWHESTLNKRGHNVLKHTAPPIHNMPLLEKGHIMADSQPTTSPHLPQHISAQRFETDDQTRERILASVTVSANGCWEWNKKRSRQGYGLMRHKGREDGAHRVSYKMFIGPLEMPFVCHHCDNPPCVNPNHLFAGDALLNVRDMVAKGRNRTGGGSQPGVNSGERNGRALLSATDVALARALWATGKFDKQQLANMFSVGRTTMRHIIAGTSWKHQAD